MSDSGADEAGGEYDIFISLRFGEAGTEGALLKSAMERAGKRVFLCNMLAGENLMDTIYAALRSAKLVVILATTTYGRQTPGGFST